VIERLAILDRNDTTSLELGSWFERCGVRQGGRPALDTTDVVIAARLFANGALRHLQSLWLACEDVGADGLGELASALAQGALPRLKALYVSRSGYVHLKAACRQRGILLSYLKEGSGHGHGSGLVGSGCQRSPPRPAAPACRTAASHAGSRSGREKHGQ